MNCKVTVKIGDKVQVMDDEQTSRMFGGDQKGFEQLLEAKGGFKMLTNMMDVTEPTEAGKRIEMIIEFDDGQYIVIGRKPKEPDDGR